MLYSLEQAKKCIGLNVYTNKIELCGLNKK